MVGSRGYDLRLGRSRWEGGERGRGFHGEMECSSILPSF